MLDISEVSGTVSSNSNYLSYFSSSSDGAGEANKEPSEPLDNNATTVDGMNKEQTACVQEVVGSACQLLLTKLQDSKDHTEQQKVDDFFAKQEWLELPHSHSPFTKEGKGVKLFILNLN